MLEELLADPVISERWNKQLSEEEAWSRMDAMTEAVHAAIDRPWPVLLPPAQPAEPRRPAIVIRPPQEQLGKEGVGAAPPTADELGKLLDRAAPGADYLAASLRGQFPMRTESAGAAPEGLVLAGPADLEQQLIGALQALQLSERRRNGASLSGEVNEHEDLELDLVRDPGDSHRMLRCKACQVDGPFAIALSDNGQWNLECVNCCETAAILTEVLAKLR